MSHPRNGGRAAWLPAEDYSALLAEPLERARRRLNIRPPTFYDAIPEDARADAIAPGLAQQAEPV